MITTLFAISFLGMFVMVGSKIFEIKVRKVEKIVSLCRRGDAKIHQFVEKAIAKYNLYRKIVHIFIFDFLPSYAYELSVKLKDYLAKKYYEAGNKFRGRRILRDNGSVSAFLQNISEHKAETHHKINF